MPRAYTGSQYSAPVPDASAFAINSADDTKQVRVNLNPLAPNTTAVITVTGPGTFPDPGTGGVVIGAAVTGGVAGRVLFEGAGPVVADDAGLTYNAATDVLTAVGGFNGNATTSTTAGTVTSPAQGAITSLGILTSLTIAGNTTFNPGGDTPASIKRLSDTPTYNSLSFNASNNSNGMIGMYGGASGDTDSLYLSAPTGGDLNIVVGGAIRTILTETKFSASVTIGLPVFIVATLPNAGTAGQGATAFVTDATAPAFGVAVVGTGAVKVPVYSDGSAWIVG